MGSVICHQSKKKLDRFSFAKKIRKALGDISDDILDKLFMDYNGTEDDKVMPNHSIDQQISQLNNSKRHQLQKRSMTEPSASAHDQIAEIHDLVTKYYKPQVDAGFDQR